MRIGQQSSESGDAGFVAEFAGADAGLGFLELGSGSILQDGVEAGRVELGDAIFPELGGRCGGAGLVLAWGML